MPATVDLIDAELRHPAELAHLGGVRLAEDWPPEHHDPDFLRHVRQQLLLGPAQAGWWLHYVAFASPDPTLVGTAGFAGPPSDGAVEIGYSVVPSRQRRGIATAAIVRLLELATTREPNLVTVVANTLPDLVASRRVLERSGFVLDGSGEPGVLRYARSLHQGPPRAAPG